MILTGRVQDRLDHPMLGSALNPLTLEPVPGKPPVGMPYLDGSFGTIITRIAEAKNADPQQAILKPMYSTMQAWNAGEGTEGESILLLWDRSRGHVLYNGEYPYNFLSVLPIAPTDIEHVVWDPVEPFVLYYPTQKNQGRCQLLKVTLKPAYKEEVYFDFSAAPVNAPITAPRNRFGFGRDPEIPTLGPRKIIGLCAGTDGEIKIVYSIAENKVLSHFKYAHPEWVAIAPVVTPSEQRIYMGGGYVFGMDWAFQRRLAASFYYEHSQIGANLAGDTWNAIAFDPSSPGANDSGTLVTHDLATGKARVILGPSTGWPYPASGTHISACGPTGWVLVSSVGSAHNGQNFGDNEITLANTDTGEFYRVGHTRTWAGTNCGPESNQCPSGYFGESHGCISRKGNRFLFGSDGLGFTGLPFKSVDPFVGNLDKGLVEVRVKHLAGVKSLSPFQPHDAHLEGYEVVV